jgi:hypothetical protein
VPIFGDDGALRDEKTIRVTDMAFDEDVLMDQDRFLSDNLVANNSEICCSSRPPGDHRHEARRSPDGCPPTVSVPTGSTSFDAYVIRSRMPSGARTWTSASPASSRADDQ